MSSQSVRRRRRCASSLGAIASLLLASSALAQIQTAGDLYVSLDAKDASAGADVWINTASESIGNFVKVGAPFVEPILDGTGVTFNTDPLVQDAYQCENPPPEGLVGADPTRSIEVWVYNPPALVDEETILSWGSRGVAPGANMSFNYGTNPLYGAVGHWNDPADMGWDNAGGAPAAGQWHLLAYTYDGTTTRVYVDGCFAGGVDCERNMEVLGPGMINTAPAAVITLASQIEADGVTLTGGLRGTLSIGRVRIHDGVLTGAQIKNNFDVECPEFCPPPALCVCDNCPTNDQHLKTKPVYSRLLKFSGFPAFDALAVTAPAGATITAGGLLSYTLPIPAPASFNVRVTCHNAQGTAAFTWTVTTIDTPGHNPNLEVAGELFVEIGAGDSTAGEPVWLNSGTASDFGKVGEPIFETLGPNANPAITFNAADTNDAYQGLENAPAGLVGVDPTRTIEAWVFNPEIGEEETIVCWGRRGGPNGTNMSFNYGTHPLYGAVGHWGGDGPDIGWNNAGGAPEAGSWHHLVYTYDGDATTTTRVYADGALQNFEVLSPGAINTYAEHPITLAVQIVDVANSLDFGTREGTLSIGKLRIHDGVLSQDQICKNFNLEREEYGLAECLDEKPSFTGAPDQDSFCSGQTTYTRTITVSGRPVPTVAATSPPGATATGANSITVTYAIPVPSPASFNVVVTATNRAGSAQVSWTVTREEAAATVTVAEELFVGLDAVSDASAGEEFWTNSGTIGDFVIVGTPVLVKKGGIRGLAFNEGAGHTGESYESLEAAPEGLTGLDATRTVEAWVWNDPAIPDEETILSWGKRGGPNGTNVSFNYGVHPLYGAVGHWGGDGPDIGWNNAGGAPAAGAWHHLVYTYDGTTTRVYADGLLSNTEELGSGIINTFPEPKISLAQQHEADGFLFTTALQGSLTIGRVRIHDGVLSPCEVAGNYQAEVSTFHPPCPTPGQPEYADTHCTELQVVVLPAGLFTHQLTAIANDETGDPISYYFTGTDGVTTRTVGPGATNTARFNFKNPAGPLVFTCTVDDRADCDDAASDATVQVPPATGVENCINGTDDDGDSKIDCADPDCAGNAACPPGGTFHRGDADDNGVLQLTDAIRVLGFLFLGGLEPTCLDAADADDNGVLQLTDAIRILGFLFLGGPPPATPGPPPEACGADAGKELGCLSYTKC